MRSCKTLGEGSRLLPRATKSLVSPSEKQTARSFRCGPSGGLLWIDQEVVTLRGLFGNSGLLTDLRQADTILTHRKHAGCSFECGPYRFRFKAPLRATSSKSQPPHLVYWSFYNCLQNLSSDHLLSGVIAD